MIQRFRPAVAPAVVALLALGWLWRFDPGGRSISGDGALFAHYGRRVLDGEVPYRDFFDQKTPLVSYFNASTMGIGRVFSFSEITTMRAAYVLLTVGMIVLLYLFASKLHAGRLGAFVGVAALLSYEPLGGWAAAGSSPKLLMVGFGCGSWYAASRRQWLVAGFLGGLAFLAWQPGLVYVGTAGVLALRAEGSLSIKRRVLLLAAGAATPVILVSVYFLVTGALGDALRQTIEFNRDYVSSQVASPVDAVPDLLDRAGSIYGGGWAALALAVAGLLALPVSWHAARTKDERSLLESLGAYALVVTAFLVVSGRGRSDLIILLPLLAVLPALVIGAVQRFVDPRVGKAWPAVGVAAVAFAAIAVTAVGVDPEPGYSIDRQESGANALARLATLQPGDPIVNMGAFSFSALKSFPNLAKYTYTYSGVPRFVIDHESAGEAYYIDLVRLSRPKLVLYRHVGILPRFNRWLRANYRRCRNTSTLRALESEPAVSSTPTQIWVLPRIAKGNASCRPAPRRTALAVHRPQAMLVSLSWSGAYTSASRR